MGDRERFQRAADDLADVLAALEDVDLNALPTDDDVRTVLAAKDALGDCCRRCRRTQHSLASDE